MPELRRVLRRFSDSFVCVFPSGGRTDKQGLERMLRRWVVWFVCGV